MNLKTGLIMLFFGGLLGTVLQSCNKYEEGPAISLISKTERLANIWKVENYKVDGTDYTSLVSGYIEVFSKSGAYSYSWGVISNEGTWEFQNGDMEVKLTGNDNQTSRVLHILRLENKALWYYYMDGEERHEYHLSEK